MKQKVYVVTSGEYSDYRIEGIFTTPNRAERLSKVIDDSNGVDEWTLDEYGDAPVHARYDVIFHPTTSEVLSAEKIGHFGTESPRVVEQPKFHYSVTTDFLGTKGTFSADITAIRAVVYAETKEKALKVAQDAFAKYKAEKEGL